MKTIDQETVKGLFNYDPETGIFIRRKNGKIAGTRSVLGYIIIGIGYRLYAAHRLAWVYMVGDCPPEIDHVNNDGTDNRWANLRPCDRTLNNANAKRRVTSGPLPRGVRKQKNRYRARLTSRGKTYHLGYFSTPEEAGAAYAAAASKHFGEFAKGV